MLLGVSLCGKTIPVHLNPLRVAAPPHPPVLYILYSIGGFSLDSPPQSSSSCRKSHRHKYYHPYNIYKQHKSQYTILHLLSLDSYNSPNNMPLCSPQLQRATKYIQSYYPSLFTPRIFYNVKILSDLQQ